ncbi:MAG: cytochrome c oxidase subunit II [Bryobacterales bacterium]
MAFLFEPPASVQAEAVNALFRWSLLLCALILTGICGALFLCFRKFRAPRNSSSAEQDDPPQIYGAKKLEVIWTLIPAIILSFLAFFTIRGMVQVNPPAAEEHPEVVVAGHQWWWEVRYPDSGVVTANELVLPAGEELLIGLESADVVHSFWTPALAPKQDMIPGVQRHLWITAPKPGVYAGRCAEFCGAQHAGMLLRVEVLPRAEYDAWLENQRQPAIAASAEDNARISIGSGLFLSLTCSSCHAISGTDAHGDAAPDLSHFASRVSLAAGLRPNNPENLAAWLRDPSSIKAGVKMPNFHLADQEVQDLTAYLSSLE